MSLVFKPFRTCLASFFWRWFVKASDAVKEIEKGVVALSGGGGEGSEDFPGVRAVGSAVAAGEFAGNDGGAKLAFGKVVGGVDGAMIEEGKEVVELFAKAIGDGFFEGIGSRGNDQLLSGSFQGATVHAKSAGSEFGLGGFELLGAMEQFP